MLTTALLNLLKPKTTTLKKKKKKKSHRKKFLREPRMPEAILAYKLTLNWSIKQSGLRQAAPTKTCEAWDTDTWVLSA